MVPNAQRPTETDGSEPFDPGFDEAALYRVVRAAVKDALLDVIGTVLLLGIAFVLVIAGIQAVFSSISLVTVAIGIGVVAVGVSLAAATLEIIPPSESGSDSVGMRRRTLLVTHGASVATLSGCVGERSPEVGLGKIGVMNRQ